MLIPYCEKYTVIKNNGTEFCLDKCRMVNDSELWTINSIENLAVSDQVYRTDSDGVRVYYKIIDLPLKPIATYTYKIRVIFTGI